jgi:hypothetical protein
MNPTKLRSSTNYSVKCEKGDVWDPSLDVIENVRKEMDEVVR